MPAAQPRLLLLAGAAFLAALACITLTARSQAHRAVLSPDGCNDNLVVSGQDGRKLPCHPVRQQSRLSRLHVASGTESQKNNHGSAPQPGARDHKQWCQKWCYPERSAHVMCDSCLKPSFPEYMAKMKRSETSNFGIHIPSLQDLATGEYQQKWGEQALERREHGAKKAKMEALAVWGGAGRAMGQQLRLPEAVAEGWLQGRGGPLEDERVRQRRAAQVAPLYETYQPLPPLAQIGRAVAPWEAEWESRAEAAVPTAETAAEEAAAAQEEAEEGAEAEDALWVDPMPLKVLQREAAVREMEGAE